MPEDSLLSNCSGLAKPQLPPPALLKTSAASNGRAEAARPVLKRRHDGASEYPPGEGPRKIIMARLAAMADTRIRLV
jgi:hypothetical protein